MSKTYVHDGQEVEATGRTALRKTRRSDHVLYEIKPLGLETSDPKFCKWVRMEDLYHIQVEDVNNNNGEVDDDS